MQKPDECITFELLGEHFTIKSDVPEDYFLTLVNNLKTKIQDLKSKFPNLSNIKLVIFAALDYADELSQSTGSMPDNEVIKRISNLSESLASIMEEEC
jgi:cell division protein ZapA (FtsZ GTPase activity inhibitor)